MTQAVDTLPENFVFPLESKIFFVQPALFFREAPEMKQTSLAEHGKKGKRDD